MVTKNILSELCVPSESSFGTNAIVLAFRQHQCSCISGAEIINGEKHYLGPLRNQMKREPKRLLIKFPSEGNIKYNCHAFAFHFVRWLIIHETRESKISGGGGGFVRFSHFMYVTCCRLALL